LVVERRRRRPFLSRVDLAAERPTSTLTELEDLPDMFLEHVRVDLAQASAAIRLKRLDAAGNPVASDIIISCRRSRWRSRLGVGRRGPLGDVGSANEITARSSTLDTFDARRTVAEPFLGDHRLRGSASGLAVRRP
jgi:hypothetical protein